MSNEQIQEMVNRLKGMALMIKFGHDLFHAKNFEEAAILAVNNSCSLLNFKGSSLIKMTDGHPVVIAQYGQPSVNPHSRLAVVEQELCKKLKFEQDTTLTLTAESGLPQELAANHTVYYAIEIKSPNDEKNHLGTSFIWLTSYEDKVPEYAVNTAKLLSSSMGEALFFHLLNQHSANWKIRRHFSLKKVLFALIIFSFVGAMFLKVPESTNAEFILKASETTTVYAWFDGPIAACHKEEGEKVNKGEIIAEYDISQISYRLSSAQSSVKEIEAELELERRASFIEREKLGKLKLLEARLEVAKIAVEEAQWFLDHSKLIAPTSGTLVLFDGRAELLTGKAVRTGDKIFEIYSGEGMIAEIPVNERESSILQNQPQVTLFLYTAPEYPIPAKIFEIASYPELTEQHVYSYFVRAQLPHDSQQLRYGMRGIAKLKGDKIFLGYSLLKNGLLYLRGL